MKTKKWICLLLSILLIVSAMSACKKSGDPTQPPATQPTATQGATSGDPTEPPASDNPTEAPDEYAEHYSYEMLTIDSFGDASTLPILQEAFKKFNMDFVEVMVPWDSWGTKVRTLAASNSLPEMLAWYDLSYGEYVNWVDQGVFAPIPDLSNYPNLNKLLSGYAITDKLKIDGKLYAIPKVMYANPYNAAGTMQYIYRRDWAKATGRDWAAAQSVTWDEMIAFLDDVKAQDPGGQGTSLIPFDLNDGYARLSHLLYQWNPTIGKYIQKDGKWTWSTADPSTLTGIKEIKKLYDNGYLAPDFYTYNQDDGVARFMAGRTGVAYINCSATLLDGYVKAFVRDFPDKSVEDIGYLCVQSPVDGSYHIEQVIEWWAATAFSSKMDEKKIDRFLKFADWLLDESMVERIAYGEEGIDWQRNGDQVELLWPKNAETGVYELTAENGKDYILRQQNKVFKWFILEGRFTYLEGNPAFLDYAKDAYKAAVEIEGTNLTLAPLTYDVDYFSSPVKDQYGSFNLDMTDAITKAVMSENPDQVWNEFLSDVNPRVDEILQELENGLK